MHTALRLGLDARQMRIMKPGTTPSPSCSDTLPLIRRRLQLDADELQQFGEHASGEESEPEDINPQVEDDDSRQVDEAAFDSSDEGEDNDVRISITSAIPPGYQVVVAPPPTEQLEYKGALCQVLVGRRILFNWCAVGWCAGTITSANSDGRFKVKVGGEKKTVNFWAEYSDETIAKHVLCIETYGEGNLQEDGRWVLLDLVAVAQLAID